MEHDQVMRTKSQQQCIMSNGSGNTKYESIGGLLNSAQPDDKTDNLDKASICSTGSRGYRIKRWLGVRRSTWLLSMYIVAYFVYLLGGCLLFAYLEQEVEIDVKTNIELRKDQFLAANPSVSSQELENLLDDIMYRGISPRKRDLNRSNWSFGQSFLFTVTVVTTIGYGHIHPLTNTGKTACILYAIIGIPFTLIFLSALVQRLLAPTFKLLSSFIKMLPNMDTFRVRLIHLALMGSIYLLLAILVPSVLFWLLEPDWSFLDGIYFVFISLTTIGLGDYIPGDHPYMSKYQTIYKTCVGLFLLFGLVLTSLTLTVFYDIPQLNLGLHLHRHRDIFAEEYEEKRATKSETQSMTSNQTQLSS